MKPIFSIPAGIGYCRSDALLCSEIAWWFQSVGFGAGLPVAQGKSPSHLGVVELGLNFDCDGEAAPTEHSG